MDGLMALQVCKVPDQKCERTKCELRVNSPFFAGHMHGLGFGGGLQESQNRSAKKAQKHSRKHNLDIKPRWFPHTDGLMDKQVCLAPSKNVNARSVNSV
jgi:hypothetical protein